jgi:hypothetical protein
MWPGSWGSWGSRWYKLNSIDVPFRQHTYLFGPEVRLLRHDRPSVKSSHLFINGVEPEDWRNVIINGLRTPQFNSLPPGEWLDFGMSLGRYFRRPGVYKVRWESHDFKTADLTFRVVPGHR